MINERDNRKDYLFSALIVGICLWSFSAFSPESFSTDLKSNYHHEQVVRFSTNQHLELLASINSFPFNGNHFINNDFANTSLVSGRSYILIFDTLLDTAFKSCTQKNLDIKPKISKTSMDYILSSNMGVEYQSIS